MSSAYILGILNDKQADRYHKLEMRKDQGSDRSLWQTTVKSGEVRETAINVAHCVRLVKYDLNKSRVFP